MHVATGLLQARRFCRIGMFGSFNEKCRAFGAGMLQERADYVAVVSVGVGHLRHRA